MEERDEITEGLEPPKETELHGADEIPQKLPNGDSRPHTGPPNPTAGLHTITDTTTMGDEELAGTQGASPCVGVCVYDPKNQEITVIHFSQSDNAQTTLSGFDFGEGSTAVVFGGTDDELSNGTLSGALSGLYQQGVETTFVGGTLGGFMDNTGTFHQFTGPDYDNNF